MRQRCRCCGERWLTMSRWCATPPRGRSRKSKNAIGTDMADPKPIRRWAALSLLLALALAVLGLMVEHYVSKFWGLLLLSFGEAALVGGLADWFAVRALFVHPFGIPFPHTALIPRNRPRIVREMRELVERQWLPRPVLVARVQAFDFVGQAIVPALRSLRPQLGDLLRDVAQEPSPQS